MKVTISDVARLAGVSTATVSHTINNTRYVSGETKEKVYQAIAELGYTPDASARSFRTGKKKTMTMPVRQWSKMHRGDTLQIKISKGLLGMPVIRRSGCPVDVPRSSYSRQFYRH